MIYILESKKTFNRIPENSYGGGVTMPIKEGLFIFNTEDTNKNFWKNDTYIEIDSDRFNINNNLVFRSLKKAEIIFYRLKLEEMKKSSIDFFFPSYYDDTKKMFNKLADEYPEYVL